MNLKLKKRKYWYDEKIRSYPVISRKEIAKLLNQKELSDLMYLTSI